MIEEIATVTFFHKGFPCLAPAFRFVEVPQFAQQREHCNELDHDAGAPVLIILLSIAHVALSKAAPSVSLIPVTSIQFVTSWL